ASGARGPSTRRRRGPRFFRGRRAAGRPIRCGIRGASGAFLRGSSRAGWAQAARRPPTMREAHRQHDTAGGSARLTRPPPPSRACVQRPCAVAALQHTVACKRADGGASMNGILSVLLALCAFVSPVAIADEPAPQPAPVVALVAGDWIDLGLVLTEPGI